MESSITAPASLQSRHALRVVISATPMEVRHALARVVGNMSPLELSDDDEGTVELVLAEVLNNVVEHAYADKASGVIEMMLLQSEKSLFCTVIDEGRPMPGLTPPEGQKASIEVPFEALPEGGFGWFMIRELSRDLQYVHENGFNRLSFVLDLESPPANS